VHTEISWDLKAYKQKVGETLREYICCFSKQCNELLNIMDADVIGVFIFGMTNEALIHELGRCKPQTTRELLDLATSHATCEKAVSAIFCKHKGKAQAEPTNEAKDRN
jgi:inhibitor of KinA sporulation pathway (predicted exonuclease)